MHTLVSMLIIAAAIAAVAVAGITLWLYWRRQTQAFRPTLTLELRNDGNVPARYELSAEETTGSLRFRWAVNGAPLGVREIREPMSTPPLPAPALAAPANVAGSQRGSTTVAQILLGIGNILPRSIGGPFVNLGHRLRYGQERAVGFHSMPGPLWYTSLVAYKVRANHAAVIQPAQLADTPSSATASVSAATPARLAKIWAQTPPIPPGGALSLELTIEPIRAGPHRQYPFKVLSKSVEQPERLVSESGVVNIQAISSSQRLLPLLIFAGIALLAVACSSLLLANIRILGS